MRQFKLSVLELFTSLTLLFAVGYFIAGMFAFMATEGAGSPHSYRNRFASDNTYGAAANALERIEVNAPSSTMQKFIAGILCLGVYQLSRCHRWLITIGERFESQALAEQPSPPKASRNGMPPRTIMAGPAFGREWHVGESVLRAEFLKMERGNVVLKKEDGRLVVLDPQQLTAADRDFVHDQLVK